jgi:methylenetetrahydrofolate--tRNA-(uracil-5-)-methyltransferase
LLHHLSTSEAEGFQPMNINYGLFPPLEGRKMKRADRRLAMAQRALDALPQWWLPIQEKRQCLGVS